MKARDTEPRARGVRRFSGVRGYWETEARLVFWKPCSHLIQSSQASSSDSPNTFLNCTE